MKRYIRSLGLAVCLGISSALCSLLTGCASNGSEQTAGEYLDDKVTTSRVKDALENDPQFKLDNVRVTAFKGTIQLSGFVDTSEQKNRAGTVAKSVPGVKEVVNNITVKE